MDSKAQFTEQEHKAPGEGGGLWEAPGVSKFRDFYELFWGTFLSNLGMLSRANQDFGHVICLAVRFMPTCWCSFSADICRLGLNCPSPVILTMFLWLPYFRMFCRIHFCKGCRAECQCGLMYTAEQMLVLFDLSCPDSLFPCCGPWPWSPDCPTHS